MAFATAKDGPALVDINHADSAQLRGLRGIGEKRAAAIVAFREAHGPFPGPASLAAVVGPKLAQSLRERVVVSAISQSSVVAAPLTEKTALLR
ncbi:ComEA family DNA-binding protein [Acidithiobacillus ferrivorans]|uniref:ComEA family DNA-binding protein n=1 Tax=Acidithiobacillus ferrivorans TaxID=160808 RepID=UPI0021004EB6|nr:helix-hairpin-helix domain-containing protein [Acidithiobacillus ferrivorans]